MCAYLKVHYPTEFQAAALTSKSGNTAKISAIINDCHRMGIKVLPPQINKSKLSFTPDSEKNEILFGWNAVKGLGETTIIKIIEGQPYSSFKDYLNKIQDKTATIALIKAGAFPSGNKMQLMQKYAKSLYEFKEYKPVATYPTKAKLLLEWDIDVDEFKIDKKVNKEAVLALYNQKKKEKFDKEQNLQYQKHMTSFHNQYAQDEFLWEFQSLSMFLTHNPLQEAYDLIGTEWDDIPNDNKAVVPCVIVDIKRKKDKNNNPFAYLDLCINNQIVEATIWSRQLKEYSPFVTKGSCICILGNKKENHLFVEKVKDYEEWIAKIRKLRAKPTIHNY